MEKRTATEISRDFDRFRDYIETEEVKTVSQIAKHFNVSITKVIVSLDLHPRVKKRLLKLIASRKTTKEKANIKDNDETVVVVDIPYLMEHPLEKCFTSVATIKILEALSKSSETAENTLLSYYSTKNVEIIPASTTPIPVMPEKIKREYNVQLIQDALEIVKSGKTVLVKTMTGEIFYIAKIQNNAKLKVQFFSK